AADIGRAKADEAAGEAEDAQRHTAARGDLVLGMEEQRVIIAGLLAELHRVGAERPVEALAALGGKRIARIFGVDDRLVHGEVEALDVGQLLRGDAGKVIAMLDDRDLAAVARLWRAKRFNNAV